MARRHRRKFRCERGRSQDICSFRDAHLGTRPSTHRAKPSSGHQASVSRRSSDAIWLPEQIGAFMRVAPAELQRAMLLALHTGQRQADILRLAWNQYDGKALSLRQGKTGRRVAIPCTTALREMLDGLPRDAAVILVTKSGRPFKKRYFAAQWALASAAAKISGLHFHDLRGTAVTMLAEAGCTVPEIATITGHSLKTVDSILERYLSRTRQLADTAISKLENASRTKTANQMQTG